MTEEQKKAKEEYVKSLDARLEEHLDAEMEKTKEEPLATRPHRDGWVRP